MSDSIKIYMAYQGKSKNECWEIWNKMEQNETHADITKIDFEKSTQTCLVQAILGLLTKRNV